MRNRWNERFSLELPSPGIRWQGTPAGVEHRRDLVFRQIDGMDLVVDVYLPEVRPLPVPAILWISGGGWRGMNPRDVQIVAAWLAGAGYAVIGVQYRVSGVAKFPAQIHDCKAGLRWVRANADELDVDPGRIGVWGDSAGGHLAELMGTAVGVPELAPGDFLPDVSEAVQAVCAFYPPSDLRGFVENFGDLFDQAEPHWRRWLKIGSPLEHVGPATAPHLLSHGDADEWVPLDNSTRFQDACHQAGVECTLAVCPGVRHCGRTVYGAQAVKELVRAFFDRHLKGGPARRQEPDHD